MFISIQLSEIHGMKQKNLSVVACDQFIETWLAQFIENLLQESFLFWHRLLMGTLLEIFSSLRLALNNSY